MHYLLILIVTLGACFGLQVFALRAAGGKTTKSESNYFSSIGRIQLNVRGNPKVMLLGSSITGRLPDRANGFDGFANMGCDGGSAVDVLRAMDEGILPSAPWLVVEVNTLVLALEDRSNEIGRALRRPWFAVGLKVPIFSAYARPAAFCYSRLLTNRIGSFSAEEGLEDLGVSSLPQVPEKAGLAHSAAEEALVQELVAILRRLEDRGSKAILVWFPPARDCEDVPGWILDLAARADVPFWDLGQQAEPGTVTLTDGVHMAAPSAARAVRSLDSALQELRKH